MLSYWPIYPPFGSLQLNVILHNNAAQGGVKVKERLTVLRAISY